MKRNIGNVLIVFGLVWVLGTAGGVDCDTLTFTQAIIYCLISLLSILLGMHLRNWGDIG